MRGRIVHFPSYLKIYRIFPCRVVLLKWNVPLLCNIEKHFFRIDTLSVLVLRAGCIFTFSLLQHFFNPCEFLNGCDDRESRPTGCGHSTWFLRPAIYLIFNRLLGVIWINQSVWRGLFFLSSVVVLCNRFHKFTSDQLFHD